MSQVPLVLAQIRAGGALDFRRKLVGAVRLSANGLLLAITFVWAIPAMLLIRLVRPWRHVRVGKLVSDRIGHFVADSTLFSLRNRFSTCGTNARSVLVRATNRQPAVGAHDIANLDHGLVGVVSRSYQRSDTRRPRPPDTCHA